MSKFDQYMPRTVAGENRQRQREVRSLQTARRLENASIHRGGIRIADEGSVRSTNFDGNPADIVTDPGEHGWCLGPSGLVANDGVFRGEVRSANFIEGSDGYRLLPNGDAELNQLTLRAGIITPDELSDPTETRAASESSVEGPSNSGQIDLIIPIPSWANRANVVALGSVSGTAGTGVAAQFSAWVVIQELDGTAWPAFVSEPDFPPTAVATAHHSAEVVPMEVDPFTQIAVRLNWGAQGMTQLSWVAGLSAFATFSRDDS